MYSLHGADSKGVQKFRE